jgi:hypothetical protein
LEQAERALEVEAQYKEPFRRLPARGSEHVVAEADSTMICTAEPGKRKAKRPRSWQEMRLVAASLTVAAKASMRPPSAKSENSDADGRTAQNPPAGDSRAKSMW